MDTAKSCFRFNQQWLANVAACCVCGHLVVFSLFPKNYTSPDSISAIFCYYSSSLFTTGQSVLLKKVKYYLRFRFEILNVASKYMEFWGNRSDWIPFAEGVCFKEDIHNCSYLFSEPPYKALNTDMLLNPIYFLNSFNYITADEYWQILHILELTSLPPRHSKRIIRNLSRMEELSFTTKSSAKYNWIKLSLSWFVVQ